jgi:hypothetical protein
MSDLIAEIEFEAVNGEIDRHLAGRIIAALRAVQPDAAAIREAALRKVLEVCTAEVDQMRKIWRRANNAKWQSLRRDKMRSELETNGAFEILAVLAGMISVEKEVMPSDREPARPASDIGPGDQAVAGAAPTVDELAQIIRTVDGNHTLGAGELAERILTALAQKGDSHDHRQAD